MHPFLSRVCLFQISFFFFFFPHLYFHVKYILQEDEALEEAGGNLGSTSGCASTLIGGHARVSQLALSFLVHQLQADGEVVLRWRVGVLGSDGTDLNRASITLCYLSRPQLCPVRSEDSYHLPHRLLEGPDEIAQWRPSDRACLILGWCSINVSSSCKRNVRIHSWETWESHCPRFQSWLCHLLPLHACREVTQSFEPYFYHLQNRDNNAYYISFLLLLWQITTNVVV